MIEVSAVEQAQLGCSVVLQQQLIQDLARSLRDYIRNNCPEWLEQNSPPKNKTGDPNRHVNWVALDEQWELQVRESANRIRAQSEFPVRVTVNEIARDIECRHMPSYSSTHKSKLPKTKRALTEVVESVEDFGLRKVDWMLQHWQYDHTKPRVSISSFAKRAKVYTQMHKPRIRTSVENAVQ
jgi:Tn7-like transposition protein D